MLQQRSSQWFELSKSATTVNVVPLKKIILFANTDWYLYNFRRSLAQQLLQGQWEVVLLSPPGEYVSRLQDLGFRWIPFYFSNRSVNPFVELRTILRLRRIYRRERPDLAHHFTMPS
jgi:hypothetical protein